MDEVINQLISWGCDKKRAAAIAQNWTLSDLNYTIAYVKQCPDRNKFALTLRLLNMSCKPIEVK